MQYPRSSSPERRAGAHRQGPVSVARDIQEAVRDACLWLPEAEEFLSHGSPNFRVRGKTFATYAVNHHGDGRIAFWLNATPDVQESHVGSDPENFFIPPYVGPRGWLGVRLDQGISWKRVTALVREAYEKVAPPVLRAGIGKTPAIAPPTARPSLAQIDPMQSPRAKTVLKSLRKICLELPESREATQFGHPVWQAGGKTFVMARIDHRRLTLCFWVGIDQQGMLTVDSRYRIPPYIGHNGWIALDVTDGCDLGEVAALTLQSYRHFALKRMLRELQSG